jgi:hypothetical protein
MKKDWIMEKYPLLVEAADSTLEEPGNQQVGEAVPTPYGCACLCPSSYSHEERPSDPIMYSAHPVNIPASIKMT